MSITSGGTLERAIAQAQHLARPEGFLTPKLRTELDGVIGAAYADAEAKVHVISGELKASGRHGTDVRDDGSTWIGWMAWGGDSVGSSASVGIYEMARGGEHDWLRDAPAYADALDHVIRHHTVELQ